MQRVISGWTVKLAAEMAGFSERTGHKWLRRMETEGLPGLRDRSSRPLNRVERHSAEALEAVLDLRRHGLTAVRIAEERHVPRSTVGRWLRQARLSRARDLQPVEPPNRYEHEAPGDLLHLDTKKLPNFHQVGHRITGDRTRHSRGAGYQVLHVCSDDHSRACFSEVLPDEKKETTAGFLERALKYFREVCGMTVRKILTDNGSAYRSKVFAEMRIKLGLKHARTRPYRPRTNGKAERLIQTALREWVYGVVWQSSDQRNQALGAWLHYYNHHRPHSALGGQPPVSRLNNLVSYDS